MWNRSNKNLVYLFVCYVVQWVVTNTTYRVWYSYVGNDGKDHKREFPETYELPVKVMGGDNFIKFKVAEGKLVKKKRSDA